MSPFPPAARALDAQLKHPPRASVLPPYLQRRPRRLRLPACLGALALLTLLFIQPARAQFSDVWSADQVHTGQYANLFAQWEGRAGIDGVLVELPMGWTLQKAEAVRGGYERIPLRIRRSEQGAYTYAAEAPRQLTGLHEFVFQVETGGSTGEVVWTLTPFVRQPGTHRLTRRDAFRIAHRLRQARPALAPDNRVLAFHDSPGGPLRLRLDMFPDFGPEGGSTIEFWMRTTDTDEVVVSTWNGDDRQAYPL